VGGMDDLAVTGRHGVPRGQHPGGPGP
jgi:hypothetical protein